MKYDLKKPCKSCPFVEENDFPLMPDRISEIADAQSFSCHNTVSYACDDDEPSEFRDTSGESQCYGWLVTQWAQYAGFPQATAFAARVGMFDPNALPTPEESGCFETFDDYINREEDR